MAQSLVSRIGASPVWRAGLASAFILGLAGFAAGVIPQACRAQFVVCKADAAGTLVAPDQLLPADATAAPAAAPADTVAVAEISPQSSAKIADLTMQAQQPASLTRNDLIAQTFGALDVDLTTTPGELTARKVRTVAIGPDGMPTVVEAPAQVAEAAPVVETPPVEVALAVPEPFVSDEPPAKQVAAADDEPTASAYAPVRGGSATVGRQGANVRSAPKTKGSDVLFSLAAGEDVTVTETSHGWSKVVDDSGRSGWVWNDLLRR